MKSVILVLSLVLAAGLVAACNDGDGNGEPGESTELPAGYVLTPPPDASPVTPSIFDGDVPDDEQLSGPARELVELMTRGLSATYSVTYTATFPDADETDVYLVFNDGDLHRIDLLERGSDVVASTLIARLGGNVVQCVPAGDDWRCAAVDAFEGHVFTSAGPVVFPGVDDVLAADVSETDGREVVGQDARCFLMAMDGGEFEYCLTSEGVVLYASADLGTVEASAFSPEVPAGAFELP